VRAAADNDDPRWARQRIEQALQQREVPEMVDAEGHLEPVDRSLHPRHDLNAGVAHDRVQRRKIRPSNTADERMHRFQ